MIVVNARRAGFGLVLAVAFFGRCAIGQEAAQAALDINQPEFNIIGFGDVSYISNDGTSQDGFTIGQGVAHLSALLDESLSVFAEFSATAKDSEYSFEIERAIVKYDFSDRFKLSAGRYHTPVGYWNSAFHHGSWLQTTVSRPEMIRFGSKIVPIHFVGVLLEGALPSPDALGLEYKVGLGNGRHANIARAGDAGDINGDNAWMVQINARPRSFSGLNAGLGFYEDEVSLPLESVKESTASVHMAWSRGAPEFIVEYIRSTHDLIGDSSMSGDVDAWYAQFAYRLSGDRSDWKPYARLESTSVDSLDPLLGTEGLDHDGGILGVRWDFSPYAALKAEYRNEEFNDAGRENNFRLQVSFVLSRL